MALLHGQGHATKKTGVSLQTNVEELQNAGLHEIVVARKPTVYTFYFDKNGKRLLKNMVPERKSKRDGSITPGGACRAAKPLSSSDRARDRPSRPA